MDRARLVETVDQACELGRSVGGTPLPGDQAWLVHLGHLVAAGEAAVESLYQVAALLTGMGAM